MTKGQRLRKRLGDPWASITPRDCMRSDRIEGVCGKCGGRTEPMHSPTRVAGIFCSNCCPCAAFQKRLTDSPSDTMVAKGL
jgi:hypothetical protein